MSEEMNRKALIVIDIQNDIIFDEAFSALSTFQENQSVIILHDHVLLPVIRLSDSVVLYRSPVKWRLRSAAAHPIETIRFVPVMNVRQSM